MPGKSQKAKFLSAYSEVCINELFMLEIFGNDDGKTYIGLKFKAITYLYKFQTKPDEKKMKYLIIGL